MALNVEKKVLFVCTGNIFRSAVAEWSFNHLTEMRGFDGGLRAESAGTDGGHYGNEPLVIDTLKELGIDASKHVPRKLSPEMVRESDLVVAMGLSHLEFIQRFSDRRIPLFYEIALGEIRSVYDWNEVLRGYEFEDSESQKYITDTIRKIHEVMPKFIKNCGSYV